MNLVSAMVITHFAPLTTIWFGPLSSASLVGYILVMNAGLMCTFAPSGAVTWIRTTDAARMNIAPHPSWSHHFAIVHAAVGDDQVGVVGRPAAFVAQQVLHRPLGVGPPARQHGRREVVVVDHDCRAADVARVLELPVEH